MQRKELHSIDQLDDYGQSHPEHKNFLSAARLLLLYEIVKRIREQTETSVTEDELRTGHIEPYLRTHYPSAIRRLNASISREGLTDLLDLLYKRPIGDEDEFDAEAKLKRIKKRLATLPAESFEEMVGVFLRMCDREERAIRQELESRP